MKTQAWGWLATAVLAAALNSSYHNGGLQWAHEVADRIQHNSNAVFALATGHADQFLAEAQLAALHNSPSCPLSAAVAAVRHSIAPVRTDQKQFEVMAARQERALARMEANRARMEVQVARLKMANFNPAVVRLPKTEYSRIDVRIPHMRQMEPPVVRVPSAPVVHIDYSGSGPV